MLTLSRFDAEPEDVYLLFFWSVVCIAVAVLETFIALVLLDLLIKGTKAVFWLAIVTTVILLVLSIIALSDPTTRPIILPTALLALSCLYLKPRHLSGSQANEAPT